MNKEHRTILIQAILFVTTFFTTTQAGSEWVYGHILLINGANGWPAFNPDYGWNDFFDGLNFSVPFLLILTVHEFGHYFMAKFHKVRATLPFYIPVPPGLLLSIGTLGAVIRIKDRVRSNLQHFDIGLAGPLAGFIVALVIVVYGFATLPPAEHIFTIHPEYEKYGLNYADSVYTEKYTAAVMKQYNLKSKPVDLQIGSNLLFAAIGAVVPDQSRVPNMHEMMHFPILLAGFIALFFTAMNLLPIGQLDGGHVTHGLFGAKGHKMIATVFFLLLLFYSGLGLVSPLDGADSLMWSVPLMIGFYFFSFGALQISMQDRIMYALLLFAVQFLLAWAMPEVKGYSGWLLFGFIISRFVGIQHPPSEIEEPLDSKRVILGWITLLIFVLCFSPAPLIIE